MDLRRAREAGGTFSIFNDIEDPVSQIGNPRSEVPPTSGTNLNASPPGNQGLRRLNSREARPGSQYQSEAPNK